MTDAAYTEEDKRRWESELRQHFDPDGTHEGAGVGETHGVDVQRPDPMPSAATVQPQREVVRMEDKFFTPPPMGDDEWHEAIAAQVLRDEIDAAASEDEPPVESNN